MGSPRIIRATSAGTADRAHFITGLFFPKLLFEMRNCIVTDWNPKLISCLRTPVGNTKFIDIDITTSCSTFEGSAAFFNQSGSIVVRFLKTLP
ncbi:hypothetical protein ACFLT2_12420 [Acidobacteriota bacterium]